MTNDAKIKAIQYPYDQKSIRTAGAILLIHYLHNPIIHLYYPSKRLHNHCLQFLLRHEKKEVYYGICASSELDEIVKCQLYNTLVLSWSYKYKEGPCLFSFFCYLVFFGGVLKVKCVAIAS